jgi:hypothetical protein
VGKLEILRKRNNFKDPFVDGRIMLTWIFKQWDVRTWTGPMWLRIGAGGVQL